LRRGGLAARFVDPAQLEAVVSGRLSFLFLRRLARLGGAKEACGEKRRVGGGRCQIACETGKPGTSAHFAKLMKSLANPRFRAPMAKMPNRARFTKYW
jgi:hypothetical protein